MRHFDLTPLTRSSIGFDRLFTMLDQAAGVEAAPSYPPYNIERTAEDEYRVTVAVAGFAESDLTVEVKENSLLIRGERKPVEGGRSELLYQGIAGRAFERRFQLAGHVHVTGARLENGLLHVELRHEIPEAKKPRLIQIGTGAAPTIDAVTV